MAGPHDPAISGVHVNLRHLTQAGSDSRKGPGLGGLEQLDATSRAMVVDRGAVLGDAPSQAECPAAIDDLAQASPCYHDRSVTVAHQPAYRFDSLPRRAAVAEPAG